MHPPIIPYASVDGAADGVREAGGRSWSATVALVACVLGIAATLALGDWQLRRAAGKEALEARMDAARRAPPLVVDAAMPIEPATLVDRHLRLRGRWMPDHVVYLDNRPHDGRTGFYVLMGLALDGPAGGEVVVDRGWTPRDPLDRQKIGPYETPPGPVDVDGVALADEPRFLQLGDPGERPLKAIWQNFDFAAYAHASGARPWPIVLRQEARAGLVDGLDRDWPDRDGTLAAQIARHHGYAFQWFALSAALAAFLIYRLVRRITHGRRLARP